jgi:hypothetical protein
VTRLSSQEQLLFSGDLRLAIRAPVEGLEVLIPILYLKRISTRNFDGALVALLGKDAAGFSASRACQSDCHGRGVMPLALQ